MSISARNACLTAFVLGSMASPAAARNYSFDARRIALGGTGGTPNIASGLVEDQRRHTPIVIPLNLVRVLYAPRCDTSESLRRERLRTSQDAAHERHAPICVASNLHRRSQKRFSSSNGGWRWRCHCGWKREGRRHRRSLSPKEPQNCVKTV